MSTPYGEAQDALKYLKHEVKANVMSGADFSTFNRLALDRYAFEEWERLDSLNDLSDSGSMLNDFIDECKDMYENIASAFEDYNLYDDTEVQEAEIGTSDKNEIFEIVFSKYC